MSFTEQHVREALKSISRRNKDKSLSSLTDLVLSRISPDQLLEDLNIAKTKSVDLTPIPSDDGFNFKPGDRAIYLHDSNAEQFTAIRDCLTEFRRSEYGESAIYERAKANEPDLFYPRAYCVEVVEPQYNSGFRRYVCKIVDPSLPSQANLPITCPEEDLFYSRDELEVAKNSLDIDSAKTVEWIQEVIDVKIEELRSIGRKLIEEMNRDREDSHRAFEIHGGL